MEPGVSFSKILSARRNEDSEQTSNSFLRHPETVSCLVSSCKRQIGCCCRCQPASLCCKFLPTIPESLSTPLMYTILLFLGFIFMNLMLVKSIQEHLIKEFAYFNQTCEVAVEKNVGDCSYIVGVTMIFRICLSLSLFHFILAMLTIGVAKSTSWRGGIHNGMWGLKFFALCLIFFATFLIPVKDSSNNESRTIFVVSLVAVMAALVFIIIQMALIVAMIREWCYKWLKALSVAVKKFVLIAMCLTSLVILSATGYGFKLLHENYNMHEWCSHNLPIIIANAVLCLFLSIVSFLRDAEENPVFVLFQAALLSAYVLYRTWSIIASEYIYIADPKSSGDEVLEQYCGPQLSTKVSNNDIICYVGIFMAFVAVIKKTFSVSKSAFKIGVGLPSSDCLDCCCNSEDSPGLLEDGGQKVIRNEKDGVVYNYSFLHILFCFATMFIMMQLFKWDFVSERKITEEYQKSLSFVVRLISIYAVIVIYFHTIWCPDKCCGYLDRSRNVVQENGRLEIN